MAVESADNRCPLVFEARRAANDSYGSTNDVGAVGFH